MKNKSKHKKNPISKIYHRKNISLKQNNFPKKDHHMIKLLLNPFNHSQIKRKIYGMLKKETNHIT